ncbi:MAG: 2OG-Fe(II) oxygenase [Alphaproteobacteria bacterium]
MALGLARSFAAASNAGVGVAFNPASERSHLFSAAECDAVVAWATARASSPDAAGLVLRDGRQWVPATALAAELATAMETGGATSGGRAAAGAHRRYPGVAVPPRTRDPAIAWLPRKLKTVVASLNQQLWRFDLTGLGEVTVLRYEAGDQLALHYDLDGDYCDRKLLVLLQLSRPDAYAGGALEFGLTPPVAACREQGALLAFPTWVPHRVSRVTSGTRYVVRCFALGPSFR